MTTLQLHDAAKELRPVRGQLLKLVVLSVFLSVTMFALSIGFITAVVCGVLKLFGVI